MESGPFRVFGVDIEPWMRDFELKYSVYAYAVAIFFSLAGIGLEFSRGLLGGGYARLISAAYVAIYVAYIPFTALAAFGFVYLGFRWKSRFLVYVVLLTLLAGIAVTVVPISAEVTFTATLSRNRYLDLAGYAATVLYNGLTAVLFGVALWNASGDRLIRFTAAANAAVGLVYLTLVLSFIGFYLSIPVMCLEAYVLHREDRRLHKTVRRH